MKTLKTLELALFAILFCLSACSGGDDDPINPTPTPEVTKSEITVDSSIITNGLSFTNEKGEKSISFTTNENWTLSVAATTSGGTWCTPSTTSGTKGSANVIFSVTENTSYDNRSVSVTIKSGTATKTFTISQKGVDALLVTTDKYEVNQEGGTIEIEVKANIDYKMEISDEAKDWIKDSSSRGLTSYKHSLDIAMNEDIEKREGEIYFKSGNKVETVKVYQAGGAIILLSENEFNVSDKGDTISVDIKSNIEFGVQMPDVDWIVDEASSRGLSSHTLKYIISANEGYDSRSASIVFYDKNSDLKDTLQIVQVQKDAIILSQKEIVVDSEKQTIEVKLSTNVDFEISMPDVNWINRANSRGLVDHVLSFNIEENINNKAREAEISFINKENKLTEKLKITQKKKDFGLYLPSGSEFNSIVDDFLSKNTNLKKIKFIANSDKTSESILVTDENGSAYIIANGEWLEIHTSAKQFFAHSYSNSMFAGDHEGNSPFCYIEEIHFGNNFNTSNVVNMNFMFSFCKSLISLDLSVFDTSNVRDMSIMFQHCNKLTSLDLSSFNTANVESFRSMFSHCNNLESIDVSKFDTKKTYSMNAMFSCCYKLKSVDISNFNTSNVADMELMFYGCKSLTNINLENFDTSNVTIMQGMFHGCNNITLLDLRNFDTSNVTDMGAMFAECKSLNELYLNSFNTSNVTTMSGMFMNCENLDSLNLNHFDTSYVTDLNSMFEGCKNLNSLDISSFNTSNVTNMWCVFCDCTMLKELDITNFNTLKVANMSGMFENCTNLTSLDLTKTSFENSPNVDGFLRNIGDNADNKPIHIKVTTEGYAYLTETTTTCCIGGSAKFVKPDETDWVVNHKSCYLPSGLSFNNIINQILIENPNVNKIEFITNSHANSGLDIYSDKNGCVIYFIINNDCLEIHTSASEYVANNDCWLMFSPGFYAGLEDHDSLQRLTTIDFGDSFNTSYVSNMESMFSGCSNLIELDVSGFNTSNVVNMQSMFLDCFNLTNLDVSGFNTSKVEWMSWMFSGCKKLISIDVSNFNTERVQSMDSMFKSCESVTELDVTNFDTSRVTNMFQMFISCENLESLDVSGFNTSNVADIRSMFCGCHKITELNVSNFDTSKVTSMFQMFSSCSSLTNLDVSKFNTAIVTSFEHMFIGCRNLNSLNLSSFSFNGSPKVTSMLQSTGIYSEQKPIPIFISKEGYEYLTESSTDCGIGTYAKFVKLDGTDW